MLRAYNVIREQEPERKIVIGSNMWQNVDTFDALEVPANDSNIILSFHYYNPMLLTHYRASWSSVYQYQGPVHYPGVITTQQEIEGLPENQIAIATDFVGKKYNKETMEASMAKPFAKAKELGLQLYCGEYGVLSTAPRADMLRWYADMMQIFEENNIASANWNYKSNQFGIVNRDETINQDLIDVLMGK